MTEEEKSKKKISEDDITNTVITDQGEDDYERQPPMLSGFQLLFGIPLAFFTILFTIYLFQAGHMNAEKNKKNSAAVIRDSLKSDSLSDSL